MEHMMHLRETPFLQIWNGTKTIELRLYDEKRQRLSVGDCLRFENEKGDREITVKIIALHRFKSFLELYKTLPLEKCGYLGNEEKACYKDMEAYYSEEEQKLYGVVGIEFELIKKSV